MPTYRRKLNKALERMVPEYSLLRKNLLHLSIRLANVSEDVKRELEDADSRYSFGWSYGKEKQDGKLDKLKASFFANPILDVPTTEPSNIQRYPSYCRANIWPLSALPELEIGLKLLTLFVQNRIVEFHTELELPSPNAVENPCILGRTTVVVLL
nr:Iron/ascorbate oxidoreductase [Ipomoea batatas]